MQKFLHGHENKLQNIEVSESRESYLRDDFVQLHAQKTWKIDFSMMCRNFCMRQKFLLAASWDFNNHFGRLVGHEKRVKKCWSLRKSWSLSQGSFIQIYAKKTRKIDFSMMRRNCCMRQNIPFAALWDFNNQSGRHLEYEKSIKKISKSQKAAKPISGIILSSYTLKKHEKSIFRWCAEISGRNFCSRHPETLVISLDSLWDMKTSKKYWSLRKPWNLSQGSFYPDIR